MDLLRLAQDCISIDSCFNQGTRDFVGFAKKLCEQQELVVEVQEKKIDNISYQSLVARPKLAKAKEDIVFQSHIDTLDPGLYSDWTETDHNPFKASINGDKIYGLGSASAKLDFLCKLKAFSEIGSKNFKYNPTLVASYGAEEGFIGSQELVNTSVIKPKFAIVGEPSNLKIITSSSGKAIVDIFIPFSDKELELRNKTENEVTSTQTKIFRGKAAHSSTPHLGSSAFDNLMKYLKQLPDGIMLVGVDAGISHSTVPSDAVLELDLGTYPDDHMGVKLIDAVKRLEDLANLEFGKHLVENFSEQVPTYTIGRVKTETKGIRLLVSFFLPPSLGIESFKSWTERLKSKDCQVVLKYFFVPCKISSEDNWVVGARDILRNNSLSAELVSRTKMTEASFYQEMHIPAIAFGPGEMHGNSFSANEYNLISEMESAIEVYKSFIERFCL